MAKKAMKLLLATALALVVAMTPIKGAGLKEDAKSFAPFWAQFKTAVANNNKEAIVAMTKFPFDYYAKRLTKTDFMKECDTIFSGEVQRCFRNAKPVKGEGRESYSVFCGT